MLVFRRRIGESFQVGSAEIIVLGYEGGQVKIGIDADRTIPVLRSELIEEETPEGMDLVEA